ncbi:hypothetical protein [Microlunatus sp. Gsoil 973]|uniref:hypothetical protein n=1 Tax=Microlunatus sp. Gsoil 973 TaxID=2672569 RepID=UPI0012B4CA1A|nr:hypothetical protein [Microlunatus sp. Gsoil 973]QGN34478.1 hypothetical protein GJV80_18515 [Microlunatus sp. Gsoil 973]
MPRSPRRTITITAGIVVVLALIAVIAYLAGRSTNATPPPPPAHTTGSDPVSSPSQTAGSSEPGLAVGRAYAGTGGSSKGPAGLPLGYDHNKAGAATAATNYLMWLNSIRITDKSTADAMATSAAADAATRTALIHSSDETRSGMDDLKADQLEPARGAYAVAHYSDDQATIYIWAPEVTTDRSGTTDQLWAIDAVQVVWASGDWKLDHQLMAQTGGAAVDPADPAGNPSAAEKRSILSRIPADAGEITDTADQTWFEYANAAH